MHSSFGPSRLILSTAVILLGLSRHHWTSAHYEPETDEEINRYLQSQRSVYHCYPDIAEQLEGRRNRLIKSRHEHNLDENFIPSTRQQQQQQQQQPFLDHQYHPSPSSKVQILEFGSTDSNLYHQQDLDQDDFMPPHPNLHHQSQDSGTLTCTRSNRNHNDPHSSLSSNYNTIFHHKVQNSTCVLAPVTTAGPYHHGEGHPIRQNLVEWQDGLPLYLDIGVIDVQTCKPIKGALVDIWHANATGYYSGHDRPGPGFENEEPQVGGARAGLLSPYPRHNFHEQWLRGAWPTDKFGVSRFATIFPGYYVGRATHVHMEVNMEWDVLSNGTFRSKEVVHVGQFFFEDLVNMSVDKMWPYSQNKAKHRTRNWRDSLKIFQHSHSNGFQPIVHILKINNVISEGLVGFITVAINSSASYPQNFNPATDFDY